MIINPYRYSEAAPAGEYSYHRVDYLVSGEGLAALTELKFKLADDSDYPLTGSTITSSLSWSLIGGGSIALVGDGTISGQLAYGGSTGVWRDIKIQTPIPVAVKSVMTATQTNFNGPYNIPTGVRYYVSDDGVSYTLVKEVLGYLGTASGYIETNVEP